MSYRRRDFRPDKLPERMQRVDIREHFGLHVPTPVQSRSNRYFYSYSAQTTTAGGKEFTNAHKARQRRHNQRVIRDALRGEE
jgi:hypothetical protein